MPKLNAEAKLFGIDLYQVGGEVKAACRQLMAVMRLDRWLPSSLVQVQGGALPAPVLARVRGGQWLASNVQVPAGQHPQHSPVFLLAEPYFLVRTVALPAAMPAQAVRDALALEVQTLSPFDAQQTLWAHYMPTDGASTQGREAAAMQNHGLLISARPLVATALQRAEVAADRDMEIWAQMPGAAPVLLTGFGEDGRLRRERRKGQSLLAGALLLAALVAAIAVTPTLQLRARAIDAYQQLQALARQTQPQVEQRQQLQMAVQAIEQAREQQRVLLDHIGLLQQLTQVLPDDVALQNLSVKQQSLTLQGVSDNASAVLQLLAAVPGFKEVRFPSAVTRIPNSSKESFVLTADIDMALWRVSTTSPQPAAGAAQ